MSSRPHAFVDTMDMSMPKKMDDLDDPDAWYHWKPTLRKCLAEFVGDTLFVFVGSLSFLLGSTPATASIGPIGAAFAHGLCISLLVISLGGISGGHFNPAVTLGVTVTGNMHPVLAIFYMLSQFAGGFLGALFVRGAIMIDKYMMIAGGTTNLNTDFATVGNAILVSILTTYLLVQTVLTAAVDSSTNMLAPLGIGFVVWIDILAAGMISGASMNPARSFGPACAYSIFYENVTIAGQPPMSWMSVDAVWEHHYVHWVGPLLGGAIAGVVYRAFWQSSNKRWLLKN